MSNSSVTMIVLKHCWLSAFPKQWKLILTANPGVHKDFFFLKKRKEINKETAYISNSKFSMWLLVKCLLTLLLMLHGKALEN